MARKSQKLKGKGPPDESGGASARVGNESVELTRIEHERLPWGALRKAIPAGTALGARIEVLATSGRYLGKMSMSCRESFLVVGALEQAT